MKGFKPLVSLSASEDVLINFNERLGPWTYGYYFKGTSKSLNKEVMVKVVDMKKFPLSKEHLDNEIALLKKLQGNNYIVKFAEYKFYQNTLTIVTDVCNKGNLRDHLKKNGPIPERQALHMLLQIIYGLRGLDELGYAHCALRPENILLHEEPNGQLTAVISNLIFAKAYDSPPFNKDQMPYDSLYLSPEVLKRGKCHMKNDIWALGVLYYEMLYGTVPWTGKNMKELEENILTKRLQFPLEVDNITETSINFIQKCLERDHNRRYNWGDIMKHRLIFRGLFSKGDGTFKEMNDEFKEQTPSAKNLMYGLRRENSLKTLSFSTIKTPGRNSPMKPKDRQAPFSRQSTIQSHHESEWGDQKTLLETEVNLKNNGGFGEKIEVIKILNGQRKPLMRAPSACTATKNSRVIPGKNSIDMTNTQRKARNNGTKYYDNLIAKVIPTEQIVDLKYHDSRTICKTQQSQGGTRFSSPFKALSVKAEMFGEIYELAIMNREYPLHEKIIKLLEEETQCLDNGVDEVKQLQQKFSMKVQGSKSTSNLHGSKSSSNLHASPKKNAPPTLIPAPKSKLALAKKEKSKKIYDLLNEIMASLKNYKNPNVCNEDILNIAANFKILREFDEMGENVVRELEGLKDCLLTFYRKKHFDHLKYLLLVKNLV